MIIRDAEGIKEAIHLLATGRTQEAIDKLRAILRNARRRPPPVVLINGKDPRYNNRRL